MSATIVRFWAEEKITNEGERLIAHTLKYFYIKNNSVHIAAAPHASVSAIRVRFPAEYTGFIGSKRVVSTSSLCPAAVEFLLCRRTFAIHEETCLEIVLPGSGRVFISLFFGCGAIPKPPSPQASMPANTATVTWDQDLAQDFILPAMPTLFTQ
jgi:hypothetical protein